MIWAAKNGHFDVVEYLLMLKVKYQAQNMFQDTNPSADRNSAIIQAARNGHLAVVQLLIQMKLDHPGLFDGINPAVYRTFA